MTTKSILPFSGVEIHFAVNHLGHFLVRVSRYTYMF